MDYIKLLCLIGAAILTVAGLAFELSDYKRANNDTAKRNSKKRIMFLCVLFVFVIVHGLLLIRLGDSLLIYYIAFYFAAFTNNYITLAVYDIIILLLLTLNAILYFVEKRPEKKQIKRKQLTQRSIFSLALLIVVNGLSLLLRDAVPAITIAVDAIIMCICIWLISRLLEKRKYKQNVSKLTFGTLSVVTTAVALGIAIWNTFVYSPIIQELAEEFMHDGIL